MEIVCIVPGTGIVDNYEEKKSLTMISDRIKTYQNSQNLHIVEDKTWEISPRCKGRKKERQEHTRERKKSVKETIKRSKKK